MPETQRREEKRLPGWLLVLCGSFAALIALVLVLGIISSFNSGGDEATSVSLGAVSSTTAAPTTVAPTTVPPTTAAPTTVAPTTTAAPATTIAQPTTAAAVIPTTTSDLVEAPRWAVYRQGKIFLQGSVPSQDSSDELARRAAEVIGANNVVVEYAINPETLLANEAPLFVEDLVLFDFNSAELRDEFDPLLQLGAVLLSVNENVTIRVIGHTDDIGSDEFNTDLSARRVQSIVDHMDTLEADTSRLIADPRGESEPLDDNETDDGRQRNRRVEFVIRGFLE